MRIAIGAVVALAGLVLCTPYEAVASERLGGSAARVSRDARDDPEQPMWEIVGVEMRVVATGLYRLRRWRDEGISVGRLRRGSPAERVGLRTYDVLVRWNDRPVSSFSQMEGRAATLRPGDRVHVVYRRWCWKQLRWRSHECTLLIAEGER